MGVGEWELEEREELMEEQGMNREGRWQGWREGEVKEERGEVEEGAV